MQILLLLKSRPCPFWPTSYASIRYSANLLLKSIGIDLTCPQSFLNVITESGCVYVRALGQDLVGKYSQQMVKGMLQLLTNCPPETAHLRKELLIAAKHILTTDLRSRKSPSSYAALHRNTLLPVQHNFLLAAHKEC